MAKWSEIFGEQDLISRKYYYLPGTTAIEAPVGAVFMRISMVGAGGFSPGNGGTPNPGFGGGAAFARYVGSCTPGEDFEVQVGDALHTVESSGAGTSAGDSIFTRLSGPTVLCRADRGKGKNATPNKGLASASVGTVVRDGADGSGGQGGASAGDDADPYPLGFGDAGARNYTVFTLAHVAAGPGGGGCQVFSIYTQEGGGFSQDVTNKAGNGMVCVEFYRVDPEYDA